MINYLLITYISSTTDIDNDITIQCSAYVIVDHLT